MQNSHCLQCLVNIILYPTAKGKSRTTLYSLRTVLGMSVPNVSCWKVPHPDMYYILNKPNDLTIMGSSITGKNTDPFHWSFKVPYFISLHPSRWHLSELKCATPQPSLEKAVAPHSSTLAWKIPWMEKPGRLQSMRSLRVRHDWATSLSLFTFMHWRRKWQPTPVFLPGESQGQGSLVGCCLWGSTESDTTEVT